VNEARKENKQALKPTPPIQVHANIFSFLNLSHLLSHALSKFTSPFPKSLNSASQTTHIIHVNKKIFFSKLNLKPTPKQPV